MAEEQSSGDSTKLPEAEKKEDVNEVAEKKDVNEVAEMKDVNEVAEKKEDVNEVAENNENLASSNNVTKGKLATGENELKKRKRGRRGGKRRGGKNTDTAILSDLPDGILMVEDGDYVGYHCTYCNCVLGSLTTVSAHVAGFRHQLITETKGQSGEEKQNEGTTVQSESEKLENVEEQENISNVEASLPLKSCLEDDLATIADPVIGLDYITEKRAANKEPSFECRLCNLTSNADDMKDHIIGTRHRLMYLKTKDPQKIAELMTKNLQKTERNKEIKEYSEVLMNQQGRGTIVVETESLTEEDQTVPSKKPKKISGDQTVPSRKPKKISGAERRRRNKRRAEEQQNATVQGSFQIASQKKGNQGTSNKKRKRNPGQKRKNPFNEANSSKWKQQRGKFQKGSNRQIARKTFSDRNQGPLANQYHQTYAYRGQPYQTDRDEERFLYGNDYPRDYSPSNQTRKYQNEEDPVKLHDIDVTNEEEAGVVMNVINSLTESFLKYKLKNVAGPAKEILEKSLKGKDLLCALTGEDDKRVVANVTNTSSLPKRNKAGKKRRRNLNKKSVGNRMVKGRNRNNERNDIPTRGVVDLPQRGWDKSRDTAYPRERMNQPQSDWNDSRDTYPRDPRDRRNQRPSNFNDTRDERPREVIDRTQQDWHKARYVEQPQHPWNETRDATSNKSRMDQPRDWSENRDPTYRRDVISQPQRDWNEGKDTIYASNRASQPPRDWDDLRDTRPRDVMDHPRHDWNENRNVGTLKNEKSIEQYQYSRGEPTRASEASENANSFSQFPRRQTPFTAQANFDSLPQSHYHSDKAGGEAVSLRNANFDSFSHHRQSQAQHTLPKTDSFPMKSQNSRYFGQTSMGWNEKSNSSQLRSTTDSFATKPSYLQGNTSSLPIKKNIDYHNFVDDMFDNYQKKMKGESSRSTITNMNSGNSGYPTNPQHLGPPTRLSYNRPSTFGQPSFSSWK